MNNTKQMLWQEVHNGEKEELDLEESRKTFLKMWYFEMSFKNGQSYTDLWASASGRQNSNAKALN